MKAAVYRQRSQPGSFSYEDRDKPVCLDDEVLVQVEAIAIDIRDTFFASSAHDPLGYIPGSQCAGTIVHVGSRAVGRKVGDRVVMVTESGSHAEFATAPSSNTWIIPSSCSFERAAIVPLCWGSAHETISEFGNVRPGEFVFINTPLNAFGRATVQLAKRAGARVIAAAASSENLQVLYAHGADIGINSRKQDIYAEIYRITGGRGVRLAVDCLGGDELSMSISALSYRGRLVAVGCSKHDISPSVTVTRGNKLMQGVMFDVSFDKEKDRVHEAVTELLLQVSNNSLSTTVERRFALRDVEEAHQYARKNMAYGLTVMLP